MEYKIDVQRYNTNEIVGTTNINADNIDMAVKLYDKFISDKDQKTMYYTLSDGNNKPLLTSNETMKHINSAEMAYKYMPFGTANIVDREVPSIYIAVNKIPLSNGVKKLAETLASEADVDMCVIATSEQKDIRQVYDYIRENMPSINYNNIFFVSDDEKDKTKYIKQHHHNPKGRYIEHPESQAEISILLSSSEKDIADWSEKGGMALKLVDENSEKPQDIGFVNVSSADEHTINGACIGILHEFDNLTKQVINDKQLNMRYEPQVEGQLVPTEPELSEQDEEDFSNDYEENYDFCLE